jgi:hypothetical protein
LINTLSTNARSDIKDKTIIGVKPVKRCDHNLKKTIELVDSMIELANEGDAYREDVGCGILFGIMRDTAYRLKKLAEEEKQKHIKKGWWHEEKS